MTDQRHRDANTRVFHWTHCIPEYHEREGHHAGDLGAYESSTKVGVQGTDRVLLQGQGNGLTTKMWFNKATNTIETAYPVTR